MSMTCPRCRLFSPDEAVRCDCGYDFAAREVRDSYLAAHVVQKHGGLTAYLETQARRNILSGVGLLGLGIVIMGGSYLGSGGVGIVPLGLIVWGGATLLRGFNHRSAAARSRERERLGHGQEDPRLGRLE
jgi:hypothetical protein